jgi:predicted Rossmann fold nucleotide-binding protein DprA/Smf involved in DNA uptake
MTRYGFTGTRRGLSVDQQAWLATMLDRGHSLHHGACIGADQVAHQMADGLGLSIVVHPPVDRRQVMLNGHYPARLPLRVLPPKPFLDRNHDIVDVCDLLLACPDGPERLRSGTWATVRYARKTGKAVLVCLPDGRVDPG